MKIKAGFSLSYFSLLLIFVLFLQITDTYKLLLLIIQKKTIFASIVTLFICLVYLFLNFGLFINLLKESLFRRWFNLIWTIPTLITTLHFFLGNINFEDLNYWFSFILLFGCMFAVSVMIFSKAKSHKIVRTFFGFAIVSIIISFIIGFLYYDIIRAIMFLSAETADIAYIRSEGERALGFFAQSNIAARAIIFYSILLFLTYFLKRNKILNILFISLTLFLITLTGSRTALLIFLLFLLFYVPRNFFPSAFFINSHNAKLKRLLIFLAIPVLTFFLLFFISSISDILVEIGLPALAERLKFFDIFQISGAGGSDKSLEMRLQVIGQYIEKIENNLLIGHGPALRETFIKNGTFEVASQNQYLEDAFAYGLVYIFYFIYVIWKTISGLKSFQIRENKEMIAFFKFFILILVIYGFSVNYLLINRIVVITLGCFIGMILGSKNNPKYSLSN